MDIAENDSDEVRNLRRTMQDLVAFSAGAWTGLGPDDIVKNFANVLLNALDLDLVYIRVAQPGGSGFTRLYVASNAPMPNTAFPKQDRHSLRSLLALLWHRLLWSRIHLDLALCRHGRYSVRFGRGRVF